MDVSKIIKRVVFKRLYESLSYDDVLNQQKKGSPYSDAIFSNETSEFVEEKIHIDKLRELNEFEDEDQTVSYFDEIGMDEDFYVSRKLMNKLVDGIELNPIVVDENYKILDGSHRLAAYSELWLYHGYDFPFDGILKIYKRVKN